MRVRLWRRRQLHRRQGSLWRHVRPDDARRAVQRWRVLPDLWWVLFLFLSVLYDPTMYVINNNNNTIIKLNFQQIIKLFMKLFFLSSKISNIVNLYNSKNWHNLNMISLSYIQLTKCYITLKKFKKNLGGVITLYKLQKVAQYLLNQ